MAPESRYEGGIEVLALPGVVHLVRAIRDEDTGDIILEAWSPDTLSGLPANCCLSDDDRRKLAAFLLEGLET